MKINFPSALNFCVYLQTNQSLGIVKGKNVTIYDVAALAGVSKGTVDRVVYNRGRVSEKTAAAVRDAIVRLGYNPNLLASVLASNKTIDACCRDSLRASIGRRYTKGSSKAWSR